MRTLVVAKQKGGVGASTVTRELAVAAAMNGLRVALVDLDPQHTLSRWWNRRTEVAGEGTQNPGLADVRPEDVPSLIGSIAHTHDLLIVDTPPSVHAFFGGILRLADTVLLPTGPTTDDLDALPDVLSMVQTAQVDAWAFVITRAAATTGLYADTLAALARVGRVAPPLRSLTAFPSAAATGRTALEAAPRGKAAADVRALWDYTAGLLRLSIVQRPLQPDEATADENTPQIVATQLESRTLVSKRARTRGRKDAMKKGNSA